MKESNKKFDSFAYNLIAESLKRWAASSSFVAEKLKVRLKAPIDELDQQIAGVMFDTKGELDLKPVPKKYDYSSGDGEIAFKT